MEKRLFISSSFALVAALAAAAPLVACSSSEGSEARPTDDPTSPNGPAGGGGGGEDGGRGTTPEVTGTPGDADLVEDKGVFVAPAGSDRNEGTRARPVATIQLGIDIAKRMGKRVYVCGGTYREALVLADSVSVIGGLRCTDLTSWHTDGQPARIESPTSPAVRAKDITSPTRLERLDIKAPDAVDASGSSIGLFADNAAAITIVRSTITSGKGADGEAGTEGVQLTPASSFDGTPGWPAAACGFGLVCPKLLNGAYANERSPARLGTCNGEAGHDGEPGGRGGAGGIWRFRSEPTPLYSTIADALPGLGVTLGELRSGGAGQPGTDGPAPATIGTLGPEGYVAEAGRAGTSGAPGQGGSGGHGAEPVRYNEPAGTLWRGITNSGGGAGGCPGLAGTAGQGGGASIAIALVNSPIVLDDVKATSGAGGRGGKGSFGSKPSAGGAAGPNLSPVPASAPKPGGSGGRAGISTNGSNGPSLGIFHTGPAPTMTSSTLTPGAGGAAIAATSNGDNTSTIPATPAGLSKDIFTL